jgi:hypothetical protein
VLFSIGWESCKARIEPLVSCLLPGISLIERYYIRPTRICLILDLEAKLHWPSCNCLSCIYQVRGEMPLDPLAKETIGYLDSQGVAFATEPKMYPFSKPECKPGLTELFSYCRS